jgi:hypothetical protein
VVKNEPIHRLGTLASSATFSSRKFAAICGSAADSRLFALKSNVLGFRLERTTNHHESSRIITNDHESSRIITNHHESSRIITNFPGTSFLHSWESVKLVVLNSLPPRLDNRIGSRGKGMVGKGIRASPDSAQNAEIDFHRGGLKLVLKWKTKIARLPRIPTTWRLAKPSQSAHPQRWNRS